LKCPFCATLDTKVIDSRLNQLGDIIRRRRECPHCEGRFTTYERVEELMPAVIKKDGRREPYLRDKLSGGILKACQKRSVPTQKLEELVNQIERRVQSFGLKEIPTRALGQMVMSELHRLDNVAYIRFASVYREFKDVDEFLADLKAPPALEDDPASLSFPFAFGGEGQPPTPAAEE
jgi:transcriptional repressor NrdR